MGCKTRSSAVRGATILVSTIHVVGCLFTVVTAANLHQPPGPGPGLKTRSPGQLTSASSLTHSTGLPPPPQEEIPSRSFLQNNRDSTGQFHTNLTFVFNNPDACITDTFLVIMVCSSAENFERRSAIRDTWGSIIKHVSDRTRVIFLLGLPSQEQFHGDTVRNIQNEINLERTKHGDILQANFEDSYRNLSLKSVSMLKWVKDHCQSVQFLLKTDDDVFINTRTLLSDLHNIVHTRFILGNIIAGAQPSRDRTSKWYTPEHLYPDARYPKYISGTAYVVSGDLISDLYKVAVSDKPFVWEDVFITGMCAQKLHDVTHVFNAKFGFKKRISDPCMFRILITGHRMLPEEQRQLWSRLNDPKLVCPRARKLL